MVIGTRKNLYNKERSLWFCLKIFSSVCPNTCRDFISQLISKLSPSTDSPGTGTVFKNTLEVIGAQTKKSFSINVFQTDQCASVPHVRLSHMCVCPICESVPMHFYESYNFYTSHPRRASKRPPEAAYLRV